MRLPSSAMLCHQIFIRLDASIVAIKQSSFNQLSDAGRAVRTLLNTIKLIAQYSTVVTGQLIVVRTRRLQIYSVPIKVIEGTG